MEPRLGLALGEEGLALVEGESAAVQRSVLEDSRGILRAGRVQFLGNNAEHVYKQDDYPAMARNTSFGITTTARSRSARISALRVAPRITPVMPTGVHGWTRKTS